MTPTQQEIIEARNALEKTVEHMNGGKIGVRLHLTPSFVNNHYNTLAKLLDAAIGRDEGDLEGLKEIITKDALDHKITIFNLADIDTVIDHLAAKGLLNTLPQPQLTLNSSSEADDLKAVKDALIKAQAHIQGESYYTAFPEIEKSIEILNRMEGK